MNIGQAVKEIRQFKELSQKDLAEAIEISQTSLSQIESNLKKPSSATLEKISAVLSVPQPLIYLMAMDEEDVAKDRRKVYKALFPTVKAIIMQIAGDGGIKKIV